MNIREVKEPVEELMWFIGQYLSRPNIRMKDSMRVSLVDLKKGKKLSDKQFEHLVPFLKMSTGMKSDQLYDRYRESLSNWSERNSEANLEQFFE